MNTTKKMKEQEKQEAIAALRDLMPPGTIAYTILRRAARSGMSREISVVIVREGYLLNVSHSVALALSFRSGKCGGVVVGGCGMDAGFHLIHSLSYVLHGRESRGEATADPFPPEPTRDNFHAGYSLKHRWL